MKSRISMLALVALVPWGCVKTYEYQVRLAAPKAADSGVFEDAIINAQLSLLQDSVAIRIKNKAATSIQIPWDSVSFVGTDGQAQRVIHTGVKLIDRSQAQAPTVVPPGAMHTDEITPADNIHYESGQYGGWRIAPILPNLADQQQSYVGKRISVFLPIEVGGKRREYKFDLEITSVVEKQP